jgi:hypothetical protein
VTLLLLAHFLRFAGGGCDETNGQQEGGGSSDGLGVVVVVGAAAGIAPSAQDDDDVTVTSSFDDCKVTSLQLSAMSTVRIEFVVVVVVAAVEFKAGNDVAAANRGCKIALSIRQLSLLLQLAHGRVDDDNNGGNKDEFVDGKSDCEAAPLGNGVGRAIVAAAAGGGAKG